ncbi:MAG TPA: TIGR03000 domain-containing protein [Gemmataceae bacterium]|jgi:uncharacterized protein (TIGR03000 family)
MYSMVLMAALTTGTDMPDGRRGGRGGCCGCYGGMAYGGGYGGCMGMGYGGGYGGCMGMGYGGGFGGCYGMGYGGGYRMGGGGGWGGGYGRGYVLGGASPWVGGYASAPMISGNGMPLVMGNPALGNAGMSQSFFFNPNNGNQANEATIVVHLPAEATLTIDGQPTQSTSGTRTFTSPPLEPGKTYSYTLKAEMKRDGRPRNVKKTIDVRAGQPTEVTLNFDNANRDEEQLNAPPDEQSTTRKRVPPPDR